jgi:hypothetical protein
LRRNEFVREEEIDVVRGVRIGTSQEEVSESSEEEGRTGSGTEEEDSTAFRTVR